MGTLQQARQVARFVWTHPANRRHRLRGMGRAAVFQLRGRLWHRPTLATIGDSGRMWAELHHAAASKVVYANPPDWPEMQAWRRILRPGDLFVDVGSNVGAYALWAAQTGASVIAIEPDPAAARRLRDNVALNRFAIEVIECALAAEPGRAWLTSGQDTTNHLLTARAEHGREVTAHTLDEIIGNRWAAGVKIDVEGAERLVLGGAARALAEQRIGALQLEWNEQSAALLGETRAPLADLLRRNGYQLTRPDNAGRLRRTTVSGYGSDVFALADGNARGAK